MIHKNRIAAGALMLMFGTGAYAYNIDQTVADDYIGGPATCGSCSWTGKDVIGDTATYGISSAHIQRNGNILTVDIFTNFAGKAGVESGKTGIHDLLGNTLGIGYGDLFLGTNWTPNGTAPYPQDNTTNGTGWTYGLHITDDTASGRYGGSGGSVELYALNGTNSDIYTTNSFLSTINSPWIFRSSEPVEVNTTDKNGLASGTWGVGTGYIQFMIDLTGIDALLNGNLAFSWAMSCGNDTIQGEVPEPSTFALAALGLIGLGAGSRVRRHRTTV